jgi:hypothetical protein
MSHDLHHDVKLCHIAQEERVLALIGDIAMVQDAVRQLQKTAGVLAKFQKTAGDHHYFKLNMMGKDMAVVEQALEALQITQADDHHHHH